MIKKALAAVALFLLNHIAWSQSAAPDERLVAAFMDIRQALVEAGDIDTEEMSKTIRATVLDAERLERERNYQAALERLATLRKYRPVTELPSFDVHMLASWLYGKLGDDGKAKDHNARAEAMREVLWRRIGKGDVPDDPVRIIMVNDMIEWARSRLARISEVKSMPHGGRELQAVTYSGPTTGNQPKLAYFEFDPRVQARMSRQISLFAPIPLAQLKPEHLSRLNQAREKREKFLNDRSFPYMELVSKVRDSMKKAAGLDMQGKTSEALEKLKEIESIRPIEEIPMPALISMYSALNGKAGNTQKQIELRGLLFGINQAIAHSGDGLSPETAVEVIAIDEEYVWLNDKKLVRVRQRLLDTPAGKYDVLTAKGADGRESDYYFNVTRMYDKYGQGLGQAAAGPQP